MKYLLLLFLSGSLYATDYDSMEDYYATLAEESHRCVAGLSYDEMMRMVPDPANNPFCDGITRMLMDDKDNATRYKKEADLLFETALRELENGVGISNLDLVKRIHSDVTVTSENVKRIDHFMDMESYLQ